jgi:3-oxoacyl-(acyl-carrier-protein) synthase
MKTSQYKLPPNVVPRIEPLQLLAVPLVEQTFLELGIFPQLLDRDRVAVLSSTMIPLEGYWSAGRRVVTSALRRLAKRELKSDLAHAKIDSIFAEIEKDSMRITEDTLSGFLNNIVAGRICNAFDFKGVSFNIDSDIAGRGSAIRTAHTLLAQNHGMVVLVHADDTIVGEGEGVQRTKLHCMILANATYALEHDLPISDILHSVSYVEEPEVCSSALSV